MRSPHPKKCVMVVACPDVGCLVDDPSTLEDAFSGSSSMTLAFAMVSAAACISRIFCPPGFSALFISANSGTLSVSNVGLLRLWFSRSRSGRCCSTPHSCSLVLLVWGASALAYHEVVFLMIDMLFLWFWGQYPVKLVFSVYFVNMFLFLAMCCCNLGYVGFM